MSDRVEVERAFDQADFDAFAMLSGDDNPIHVDAGFAAESRFGRTVAHGVLLCSVLRGLADFLLPGARQTAQDVAFPAPTYAGEAIRFSVEIMDRGRDRAVVAIAARRVADGAVTCRGTAAFALGPEDAR